MIFTNPQRQQNILQIDSPTENGKFFRLDKQRSTNCKQYEGARLAKMRYGKHLCEINRPVPHREAVSMGKISFPELSRCLQLSLTGCKASLPNKNVVKPLHLIRTLRRTIPFACSLFVNFKPSKILKLQFSLPRNNKRFSLWVSFLNQWSAYLCSRFSEVTEKTIYG